MTKLDKDQVISAFSEAYTKRHGNAPQIEAKGGWYSVNGAKNVRLAELNNQIQALAATKSPVNTSKSGAKVFSVKQFWSTKITQANPGATPPR